MRIWADFESISQQHPGGQAAAWCTGNGLDANDCYVKLISHTADPKGSSVNP